MNSWQQLEFIKVNCLTTAKVYLCKIQLWLHLLNFSFHFFALLNYNCSFINSRFAFNPIRGGLLWSGVEADYPPPPPPLLFLKPLMQMKKKLFGTVIVHYITNNLVKKIGLSRVNFC